MTRQHVYTGQLLEEQRDLRFVRRPDTATAPKTEMAVVPFSASS